MSTISKMPRIVTAIALSTVAAGTADAAFVAYNDTVGSNTPNVNTSRIGPVDQGNSDAGQATNYSSGPQSLKDIATGNPLAAQADVSYTRSAFSGNGLQAAGPASFNAGTEAAGLFDGKVAFVSNTAESIELAGDAILTYTFSGLDAGSAEQYDFAGSAVRAGGSGSSYINRWTLVRIVGADAFTAAHSSAGIETAGLASNEVALWTGDNTQGSVVRWTNIDPGADGVFSIESVQYTTGSGAGGSKGYGLAGFRLAESAVPEPASLALLALGGLAIAGRRRA